MAPPSPPPEAPDGILAGDDDAGHHPDGRLKILGVEIAYLVLRYSADLAPQAVDPVALRDGRGRHDNLLHPDGFAPVAVRGRRHPRAEREQNRHDECDTTASLHNKNPELE